jgi:protein-S-isoprenylcysteine O-methyltransferase Ste14
MSRFDKQALHHRRPSVRAAGRTVIGAIGIVAMLMGLLFVPAGRWNWIEAWLFVMGYAAFLGLCVLWGLFKDPGQMEERSRIAGNTKPWDRVILTTYTVMQLATFIVVGLDAGRFRWSTVPVGLKVTAWVGLLAAGSLIFSAVATNTYLAQTARIQGDRGQVVVTRGPYRFVRHPMYLGNILLFACAPLALGSLWAQIPGLMVGALFIIRTRAEDAMLLQELEGYAAYAKSVRYRIVPGIW